MVNLILADYYEERGFIGKSQRLRRKSSKVLYGHRSAYFNNYLRATIYLKVGSSHRIYNSIGIPCRGAIGYWYGADGSNYFAG